MFASFHQELKSKTIKRKEKQGIRSRSLIVSLALQLSLDLLVEIRCNKNQLAVASHFQINICKISTFYTFWSVQSVIFSETNILLFCLHKGSSAIRVHTPINRFRYRALYPQIALRRRDQVQHERQSS